MSYQEDHFDNFIVPEYKLESLLEYKYDEKNGIHDYKYITDIMNVINKCYNNEVDSRSYLIEYLESKVEIMTSTYIKIGDQKKDLSRNDFKYDWKLENLNLRIARLTELINTLKIWLIEKTKIKRALLNNSGIVEIVNNDVNSLREDLDIYSFFELNKVKKLNNENQEKLIRLIFSANISYQIAMFDYLEFLPHLNKHFNSKTEMSRKISKLIKSDKDGRAVRGEINALIKKSESRYKSHLYIRKVQNDYQNLINGMPY